MYDNEQYYPKFKTGDVLKALEIVESKLESEGFWFADFGTWCYGSNEETCCIQFEYDPDNLHIILKAINNTISKFSSPMRIEASNTELIESILDALTLIIKEYEE